MTVVVQLAPDGSAGGLDQPVEWLRATKALAHFDSVVPGFGIIPAGHPTAYIEFPGRSQLDAAPNRDVGHTVEALADGLRGPTGLSPSVLTLTCLDPWRECQVMAECRDRIRVHGAGGLLPERAPLGAAFRPEERTSMAHSWSSP